MLRLLKLAMKAKDLPEVALLGRALLAAAGLFVLWPVVSALLDPGSLSLTDWIGLAVLTAVGGWLVVAAVRGGGGQRST